MDAMDRMPGDAEAAAAGDGMREVYGLAPCLEDVYGRTKYVGEWLTWRREQWAPGRTASGVIRKIQDRFFVVSDDELGLQWVSPSEVMPL